MTYTPKFPKTPDGLMHAQRRSAKRKTHSSHEDAIKRQAKRRDSSRCRWPRCEHRTVRQPLDGAHLDAKGMGGTPDGRRNTTANVISICRLHHQGPRSLHSGDLDIRPLTKEGADGPCAFYERRGKASTSGKAAWATVARETSIGIYEADRV